MQQSAASDRDHGHPRGRRRAARHGVLVTAVVALPLAAVWPLGGYSMLQGELARWREDHPHATVPESTDAVSLLTSHVLPRSWRTTGACTASDADRCTHYRGTAVVDRARSSDDAAAALADSARAAGLDVQDVTCGPSAAGPRQCFVQAAARRSTSGRLVTFTAFVRVGSAARRATFALDAT